MRSIIQDGSDERPPTKEGALPWRRIHNAKHYSEMIRRKAADEGGGITLEEDP